LKWKPHPDELHSTVYHRNGCLETLPDFANTLSTSAGSRTRARIY